MAVRRRLLLFLLPLLLVAWSGCPCVYARCFNGTQGVETAGVHVCPCCQSEPQQDDGPERPVPPCERRGARNADLPPEAPGLVDLEMPRVAQLEVSIASPALAVALAPREVLPAPPDEVRRGTVLLN